MWVTVQPINCSELHGAKSVPSWRLWNCTRSLIQIVGLLLSTLKPQPRRSKIVNNTVYTNILQINCQIALNTSFLMESWFHGNEWERSGNVDRRSGTAHANNHWLRGGNSIHYTTEAPVNQLFRNYRTKVKYTSITIFDIHMVHDLQPYTRRPSF